MGFIVEAMGGIVKDYCQEQAKGAAKNAITWMVGGKGGEDGAQIAGLALKAMAEGALVNMDLAPKVAKVAAAVACTWAAVFASAAATIVCPAAGPVIAGAWAAGAGTIAAVLFE